MIIAVHQHRLWVPDLALQQCDKFYQRKDVRWVHRSPLESLYKVLFREPSDPVRLMQERDIVQVRSYGIALNLDNRFPLMKDRIYSKPLPFKTASSKRWRNVKDGFRYQTLPVIT